MATKRTLDHILFQEVAGELRQEINAQTPFVGGTNYSPISKLRNDLERITRAKEIIDKENWKMFAGHRKSSNQKDALELFLKRTTIACINGTFIIWPMLIMVLHESWHKTVLTASICVFASDWGGLLPGEAVWPFDVFSATRAAEAYAAVLVVFVGTGSNGGNGT